MSQVVVRRVTGEDWQRLRAIRLAMLADAPSAYLEAVAEAEARTEEAWRDRAERGASGGETLGLAAEDDSGRWVAYLACFVDAPGQAHVVSVYVVPEQRGTGLLARMLDAVQGWARDEARVDRLHLYVHEDNPRAHAAYRRYGFAETGARLPYDLDPTRDQIELAMPVRRAGGTG